MFVAMNGAPERIWMPPAWLWNGLAPDVLSSWVIVFALFTVGAVLFLREGARDASGEDE